MVGFPIGSVNEMDRAYGRENHLWAHRNGATTSFARCFPNGSPSFIFQMLAARFSVGFTSEHALEGLRTADLAASGAEAVEELQAVRQMIKECHEDATRLHQRAARYELRANYLGGRCGMSSQPARFGSGWMESWPASEAFHHRRRCEPRETVACRRNATGVSSLGVHTF